MATFTIIHYWFIVHMHPYFDTKFHFPTVYDNIQVTYVLIVQLIGLLKTVNIQFQFAYNHPCVLNLLRIARC